jgi:hypothetical protein
MGNLSSQYISQSFQSLLHLGSDTTASATLAEIQDALGNGVGVFVSRQGNLKVTNSISASAISASTLFGFGNPVNYSASVSDQLRALENITSSLISKTGSYATTGSNNFVGNQNVTGDITLTGTLSAYAIKTIFETSSVIFSSGSNILGDATNDTQTLIGLVRVSGSSQITGSMGISANLEVKSAISSSTITGMGNVTNFSQSIVNQFYTQTDVYNANNDAKWATLSPVTQSLIDDVYALEVFTASQQTYNTDNNTKWSTLSSYTASNNTKWTTLGNLSSSFATTGSNTFIGTETITGSVIITGSAYGNIVSLSITSNTASIDMTRGNFFTLTLASSATTRLEATNIRPGETVNLLITQPATSGSLVLGSMFKTSTIYPYIVSATGSTRDLVSLVSFDTASIYTVGANKMS